MKIILTVIFSACFLCVYIYAILLLCGIGGKVLGGYHTSTKETTALKEHKSILRKAGVCLLLITAIAHAMCLLFIFEQYIWGGVTVALLILFSILSVFILNTKEMFNKEKKVKESKLEMKKEGESRTKSIK